MNEIGRRDGKKNTWKKINNVWRIKCNEKKGRKKNKREEREKKWGMKERQNVIREWKKGKADELNS